MPLLVLVAMASFVIYQLHFNQPREVPVSLVSVQMEQFRIALDNFKENDGFYPTGTNGLNDLVIKPASANNWHLYMEKIPTDPWGHPYLYECPGKHRTNSYDLSSAGPDGEFGTEDDIVNWR